MSHSNIAIFVPHMGCPHCCSFCDQHTITGSVSVPHVEDVRRACEQAWDEVSDRSETEIAFFGGSFTAIPRDYMTELLDAAKPFVGGEGFRGIRISTRPDCIDGEVLGLLKNCGVTAIELGAQSMSDRVLEQNERGHSAQAVYSASKLIRQYGFELGLQIMVGLYKSDIADERATAQAVLDIAPDTVRIYPVCVLEGTKLAELYRKGEYRLKDFDTVIGIAAEEAAAFSAAGIRILRIGLHASEEVGSGLVAGYYHPALGEIVRSRMIRDIIEKNIPDGCSRVEVRVGKSLVSAAAGHKKCNREYFEKRGIGLEIIPDSTLDSRQISLGGEVFDCV